MEIAETARETIEDEGHEVSEVSVDGDEVEITVAEQVAPPELMNLVKEDVDVDDLDQLNARNEFGEDQNLITIVTFEYVG